MPLPKNVSNTLRHLTSEGFFFIVGLKYTIQILSEKLSTQSAEKERETKGSHRSGLKVPVCIYCLKEKPPTDFNIEHVIPESFGAFENNFTLIKAVCWECNKYFGDKLELFLGRDTFEGMLRFMQGAKAPKEFKFLNNRRILFRLSEDGPWKGAILKLGFSEEKNKIVVDAIKQVAFRKKDRSEWEFFEVEDIQSKDDLENKGFIVKGDRTLKMLFLSGKDKEEIEQQLQEKGFKISMEKTEDLPFDFNEKTVKVQIIGTIDRTIFRGIGKIAFNYLAYHHGKDFALNENFNEMRDFVRYGMDRGFRPVIPHKSPILHYEKRFGIQETGGHIITLDWNARKTAIISQVTLFNEIVYQAILCRDFRGLYREISTGHHFDIESKKITMLLKLPKRFFIPGG